MPMIPVTTEPAAAALRKAASTLKAAAVVSAAAILSQGQGDLEANAKAAADHLDDVAEQVHSLRSNLLKAALTPVTAENGSIDVDIDALDRAIDAVDLGIGYTKDALFAVVENSERDGLETFVERIGSLGRALQDVSATLGTAPPPAGEAPFSFDQFFLDSMQDLSQRDWSDSQA